MSKSEVVGSNAPQRVEKAAFGSHDRVSLQSLMKASSILNPSYSLSLNFSTARETAAGISSTLFFIDPWNAVKVEAARVATAWSHRICSGRGYITILATPPSAHPQSKGSETVISYELIEFIEVLKG